MWPLLGFPLSVRDTWAMRILMPLSWTALIAVALTLSGCGLGAGGEDQPDDPHAGHDHGPLPADVLEVSDHAQKSMNIEVRKLQRSDYARFINIPGQVVKIPGLTQRDVTAKSSGEIARIHVLDGQAVWPGEPLFEMGLVHEEAIQHQLDLLDALAKQEVVRAELTRLKELETKSPGAVAGTRLLKQQYELSHLEHTVESRKQMLVLLGLDPNAVETLVERHREHHRKIDEGSETEHKSRSLIVKIQIVAPEMQRSEGKTPSGFIMERLLVSPGQHVDVGDLLCRLGDFRHLYIEGQAFERDLAAVRRAKSEGQKVQAVVDSSIGTQTIRDGLPIVNIDPVVDSASRSARFYVDLDNINPMPKKAKDRPYPPLQFIPGQRVELRVPVQSFPQALVVPVEAVAIDGLDNYIFQVSGDKFLRREVTVIYRDEEQCVLGEEVKTYEGKSIAMSAAYQLQLSLLNRARGPVENSHAGHSH